MNRCKILIISFSVILMFMLMFLHFPSKENKNVIEFSSWGSQTETKILKDVISEYEKQNPDIKIKFLHIPQNYFQKIQLLFASGLEPDVIFINNQNIKMYINAGLLEDLTDLYKKDRNSFFKESLDCFTKDGKLYAIPRDISNLVIYYNKDIFNTNGIKLNKLSSLNDILLIGEKVKRNNIFAINSEDSPLFWLYYLASNGGGAISSDEKNIIINSSESIKSLQFCSDLINKYHYAPSKAEQGSMTTAQMFINGKLAMYLGGRWMVPKFRETIKFNWDVMMFPAEYGNKLYIDSSGWAISKKSKNKKAAAEFIKYLSSEESLKKFAQDGLIIPARKKTADEIIKLEKNQLPHNSKIFVDMIENAMPTPVSENYGMINDILTEKAGLIFYSNISPDKAFDNKTIKQLEGLL